MSNKFDNSLVDEASFDEYASRVSKLSLLRYRPDDTSKSLDSLFEKDDCKIAAKFESNAEMIDSLNKLDYSLEYAKSVIDHLDIHRYVIMLVYFDYDEKKYRLIKDLDLKKFLKKHTSLKIYEINRVISEIEKSKDIKNLEKFGIENDLFFLENKGLTPGLFETIDMLTDHDIDRMFFKQLCYSILYSRRFEDRIIVMKGSNSAKELAMTVLNTLSAFQFKHLKSNKVDAESLLLKRVFYCNNKSALSVAKKLLKNGMFTTSKLSFRHESLFIVDETLYDDKKCLILNLTRSTISDVDDKKKLIQTKSFYQSAIKAIKSESTELSTDIYYQNYYNKLNTTIYRYLEYLSDLGVIGCVHLPSSILFAIYEDYCKKFSIDNILTQTSFTRMIGSMLEMLDYTMSKKVSRMNTIFKNDEYFESLLADLSETHPNLKKCFEEKRNSKIFELNDTQLHSEDILTDNRLSVNRISAYGESALENNSKVDELSTSMINAIKAIITPSVLSSTYLVADFIELTSKLLVYEMSNEEILSLKVDDSTSSKVFSMISDFTNLDLTDDLVKTILHDRYESLKLIEDEYVRLMELDKLDSEILIYSERLNDFRVIRLIKEFNKAINLKRKNKIRDRIVRVITHKESN